MNITHIISGLTKGGAERAAVDLANWQAEQGHRVSMLVGWPEPDELLRNDLDARIAVSYVSPHKRGSNLKGLAYALRRHAGLLSQDIIHSHLTFGAVLASALFLIRGYGGARIVETYHAAGMPIPGWKSRLDRILAKMRDSIVLMAPDARWKALATKRAYPRVTQIENGLAQPKCRERDDPMVVEYARVNAPGLISGGIVIGTVSRAVNERKPDLVLEVFAKVNERAPNVHFLFVGDGPELNRLKSVAGRMGLAHSIAFTGQALDASIPLALVDIYLTLAVGDTVGLAAVQAAFCAHPVVAIQLEDSHRYSSSDWVWSDPDPAKVADKIVALIDGQPERRDLGKRQQLRAREHSSIIRAGTEYDRLYRALLTSRDHQK